MPTDWKLIRGVMSAAIDACERLEATGVSENDRGATTKVGDADVTIWEFLQSAWVMPENFKYRVVRARHHLNDDMPYTPELARVIRETASFCAELIGAARLDEPAAVSPHAPSRRKSLRELASELESWYANHFVQGVSDALARTRK